MSLLSIEKLEIFLNKTIDISEDGEYYDTLLNVACSFVENYLGRNLSYNSYTENFSGYYKSIVLENYPVDSIDTITVDGTEIDSDNYFVDTGIINFTYAVNGSISVTYSAGYKENDLDMTLLYIISDIVKTLEEKSTMSRTLKSEKIGDYSYEYKAETNMNILMSFSEQLDKYKETNGYSY